MVKVVADAVSKVIFVIMSFKSVTWATSVKIFTSFNLDFNRDSRDTLMK